MVILFPKFLRNYQLYSTEIKATLSWMKKKTNLESCERRKMRKANQAYSNKFPILGSVFLYFSAKFDSGIKSKFNYTDSQNQLCFHV